MARQTRRQLASRHGLSAVVQIAAVSAEYVAVILRCEPCRKVWVPAVRERWQAHWIDEGPEEIVFYCRECSERELEGASDAAPGEYV
jgi:hypothetical protein